MRSTRLLKYCFAVFCGSALMLAPAQASTYDWATWTTQSGTTVNGSLTFGVQTVNLTYTGEVYFTQLNNAGTNYYLPTTTFADGPTTTDMISIFGSGVTHTVTFSSPVVNPVMAIVSLGQPALGTIYNFDSPFTILSQGTENVYGGCATCLSGDGTSSLKGTEGDGIIEFVGTFSSLSWTASNGEYWNGFTFGAAGAGTPTSGVPEPGSLALTALAIVGSLVLVLRRRLRA